MKLLIALLGSLFFITACSDKKTREPDVNNTYYIAVSADDDSLQKALISTIDGKASYHKNGDLQIVSMNFLTERLPDIHYYMHISNMNKDIKKGTKKIEINVRGRLLTDSTVYTMMRYQYTGDKWEKVSDMGVIKINLDPSLTKREKFKHKEIIEPVRDNLINSTYD